jgi:hypothetical protein
MIETPIPLSFDSKYRVIGWPSFESPNGSD